MRSVVAIAAVALLAALSCKNKSGSNQHPRDSGAGSDPLSDVSLPGAEPFSVATLAEMKAAVAARATKAPHTRHRRSDGTPIYTNRLVLEASPYLQQHAHNPVNWYPWGPEAFEAARRRGVAVFLSIGYSTCHWCHVMEEETFEDVDIANYLNANYVAIKVDREERPDVDAVYMTAVRMSSRTAGWPLNVWLTPDRQPIFGTTYMPPRSGARGKRFGFLEVLQKLRRAYVEDRGHLEQSARQLVRALERTASTKAGGTVDAAAVLRQAMSVYRAKFDPQWGGVRGRASKFPGDLPVRALLRFARRTGDSKYRDMAVRTLDKMASGGIYDHVGGGFHRYAVDARWQVPHFEKMLYDNALLALAYLDGYQATGHRRYARVARDVLRYVHREMTAPAGAFYSATDADSAGAGGRRVEGAFFTWTPAEIDAALSKVPGAGKVSSAAIVRAYYGITTEGTATGASSEKGKAPARKRSGGRRVLWMPEPAAAVAKRLGIGERELARVIAASREALYRARARRPAPARDDKILTAWNGKMISALARAELVLGSKGVSPTYAARAARAATFLLGSMRQDGELLRVFRSGRAYQPAYLPDYAYLIQGLLDLFEATGERRWLDEAIALDGVLEKRFEDRSAGGFFFTSSDHDKVLVRQKPARDGARPSGNSVMALNLYRLAELTTKEAYHHRAARLFGAFAEILRHRPTDLSYMLLALDFFSDSVRQIVIVTPSSRGRAARFLAVLGQTFVPNHVLAVVPAGDPLSRLAQVVPLVEDKAASRGQVTAYVCVAQRCELPTRDPSVFARQIRKVKPLPP